MRTPRRTETTTRPHPSHFEDGFWAVVIVFLHCMTIFAPFVDIIFEGSAYIPSGFCAFSFWWYRNKKSKISDVKSILFPAAAFFEFTSDFALHLFGLVRQLASY